MTRREQAKHPDTSPEVLVEILGDITQCVGHEPTYMERCEAAYNHNLPVAVLEDIVLRGSSHFKLMVAANRSITQKAFELLCQDQEYWPNLVGNPSVPPHFLVRVSRDKRTTYKVEYAQWNVASDLRTPISALVELSKHSNSGAKARIVRNPNTPIWLKWMMAADEDYVARRTVTECYDLPLSIVERLIKDENIWVQKGLLNNKRLPPLVQMWLHSSYRDTMSLEEFLGATNVG